MLDDDPAWQAALAELAAGGDLARARGRAARHAADGGYGGPGDAGGLSPVPLMIPAAEWAGVAAGIAQRAELLEQVLADLYGPARLVADGRLPAALVAGGPLLRPAVGLEPPGGRRLRFVAFDLARGPGGEWRVLADHVGVPAGAGRALGNRLATGRALGGLHGRLNVRRHAPFFAAFRDGLAAACRRAEPRIGLLAPGRRGPDHPEQAHLARYLGLPLVEGADLTALDGRAYLRTVAGLKRVDALWAHVDARLLDPLAFDSRSPVGVPGLVDAYAAGDLALANAPGAGALEAPAWLAFLPRLAEVVLGEPLRLPNVATWWCGGEDARAAVEDGLDAMELAPAFGIPPLGLPDGPVAGAALDGAARRRLLDDLARRPQDYVGRERVRRSTMPAVDGDRLVARTFTVRVFAARDARGGWAVLPGGLARLEGGWSADVCVHGPDPVAPVSLLPSSDAVRVRRNPGTLPSRVADDFFWLGRYLERAEALLAAVVVLLGHAPEADGGGGAAARLAALVAALAAVPPPQTPNRPDLLAFARAAVEDEGAQSVAALNRLARDLGEGLRDRLSPDMARLLGAPHPTGPGLLDRAGSLGCRYAALAGLSAEHMGRTAAWRFHDLGRRIERATAAARAARLFGPPGAGADDLSVLLELAGGRIDYRQLYPTGLSRAAVVDLVALDPGNPRALAFGARRIAEHLRALPVLADDGMAEPQQADAAALRALVDTADAAALDVQRLEEVERRLARLSDSVARRYFLQGAEPLRAERLTLA